MKTLYLILSFVALSMATFAQKSAHSVFQPEYKVGVGYLLYGDPGFAFTNEFSVPVFKGFDLAASFIYGSDMPMGRQYAEYKETDTEIMTILMSETDSKFYNNRSMYSINLLGYICPLRFTNNSSLQKHSIKVGGGIGFHHQTITGIVSSNNGSTLQNLKVDVQSEIVGVVNVQYQYCIAKKWLIGAEYSLFNQDGYGALNLLLGVKL